MVVLRHVIAVYAALVCLGQQLKTLGVLPFQRDIREPLYMVEYSKLQ